MEVRVRPWNVTTIDLKLTGMRRRIEFKLGQQSADPQLLLLSSRIERGSCGSVILKIETIRGFEQQKQPNPGESLNRLSLILFEEHYA